MKNHTGLYRPKYRDPETGKVKESTVWWMSYSCRGCALHPHGGRHRESTETEKVTDAQRILDSIRGPIADGKRFHQRLETITVGRILESVIADYRNKGRKSLDGVKRKIEKHVSPYFGHRSAVSVTGADVRTYTETRLGAGAAPAEVNRELAALRRAYVLAVKDGILPSRPHFELLPERNQRKGFFTDMEVASLCSYLPGDVKDVVIFLSETGWRIMEALTREWRHVDFKRGVIILDRDETKNEEPRMFPFTETLSTMIAERRKITEITQRKTGKIIPYVFHVNGSPLFSAGKPSKVFAKAWKQAREQAGLAHRVAHDFRRSAAMNFIRAGINEQTAMDLLGHKTPSIFRRYRIIMDSDRFEAVKRLDQVRKNGRGPKKSVTIWSK